MAGMVHLVVPCAKRKRAEPGPRLRDVPAAPAAQRAARWLGLLRNPSTPAVRAADLYVGDHWAVVRELATRPGVRVWVCSAGYGLVSIDSPLRPYSATFSAGEPDSVCTGPDDVATARAGWWQALAGWEGPGPAGPRTLESLARAFPGDALLVCASGAYLQAIAGDVRAAAAAVAPDRLAIISAGAGAVTGLGSYLLPADARLQARVGGARAALNARLARLLLDELGHGGFSRKRLRTRFDRLMAESPAVAPSARRPMTDEQVRAFIRAALAERPRPRATPLLRRLRDSGRACEHARFTALYRETLEQTDGD